jgi:hypothetical protein
MQKLLCFESKMPNFANFLRNDLKMVVSFHPAAKGQKVIMRLDMLSPRILDRFCSGLHFHTYAVI